VRLLATEVGDHGHLPIVGLERGNRGRLSNRRAHAVGPHQQAACQLAPIGKPCPDTAPLNFHQGHGGFEALHMLGAPRGLDQRCLERRILDGPGQLRHARAVRVEGDFGAGAVAENAHGMHGGDALCRKRLPGSQAFEERRVSRAERIDARIESAVGGGGRGRLGDQRDRCAARCARQGEPDGTTADDDQVETGRVYNPDLVRSNVAN
jgi:hypothetical protein